MNEENSMDAQSLIITNGMFIIDDIENSKCNIHYKNVPGGGGTFAILGACIISPNNKTSKGLKWIVDRGSDFPDEITKEIESWGTDARFRDSFDRPTTKGLNYYEGDNDLRKFKFLTAKKQIDVQDWVATFGRETINEIQSFHLLCSGSRCAKMIDALMKVRSRESGKPVIIWEPFPDLCDFEHQHEIRCVMQREDVTVILSPNAEESSRLFGLHGKEPSSLEECFELAHRFNEFMNDNNMCILRCGSLGSISITDRLGSAERAYDHYPAYHFKTKSRVLDPTGGGNSFLGGFAIAYALTRNLATASICGNIAASAIIEQIGIPRYDPAYMTWNGLTLLDRLEFYLSQSGLQYNASDVYKSLSQ
ncbi:Mak32p [Saccharomyces eubayanus]|uniref:Mak32p n=1 Tax=Saccharomyces eubayanus TaxID=1080349 RepID=UPI0006BF00F4|nr:MAK32-like protein [Saccharomyces eubayanus]KOH00677.1 MAK32-like protein [Saccharomyces eubayanus]